MGNHKIRVSNYMASLINTMNNTQIAATEAEEMYLVTIAKLIEKGHSEPIAVSAIAQMLAIQPVSANQMIHSLDQSGLIRYLPYKGVELTPDGRRIAMRVLRFRRLWEVFLVRYLKIPLQEADALACKMEHITTGDLAGRLSGYLDHPNHCYHGHPIPGDTDQWIEPATHALSFLSPGQSAEIAHMEGDTISQGFLEEQGLSVGAQVKTLAINPHGAILIEINGTSLAIAPELAKKIHLYMPE